jgi:Domain of unknown function (DUF2172).
MTNVLAYADGTRGLAEIAEVIESDIETVTATAARLSEAGLLEVITGQ